MPDIDELADAWQDAGWDEANLDVPDGYEWAEFLGEVLDDFLDEFDFSPYE